MVAGHLVGASAKILLQHLIHRSLAYSYCDSQFSGDDKNFAVSSLGTFDKLRDPLTYFLSRPDQSELEPLS